MSLRAKLMLQVGAVLVLALGTEMLTVILLQRRTLSTILSAMGLDVPLALQALGRLEFAELAYAALNAGLIFFFWVWLIERTLIRPLERLESTLNPAGTDLEALTERARAQRDTVRAQGEKLAATEEQLTRVEQLALLGRLGAGLAHEIGNPLGAVMGYLSLMKDEPDPAVRAELIGRGDVELQRINGLIRELLDYARPSPSKHERLDLRLVVEATAALLTHQPRGKDVQLELCVTPGVFVLGDAQRLTQVLLNLMLNAADAMGGKGCIRIDADSDARTVVLHLHDDGPGFSAEALLHAGEPFFTTKGPGHGTGLGLAVSQTLVREMRGTLSFKNGVQSGAVVRLALNRAPA